MSAFVGISALFPEGIVEKARALGYSPANLCVLEGDVQRLEHEFPDTYSNLLSCGHNRDGRTPIEYARDLVASWIMEDAIVAMLTCNGIAAELSGNDRNRELLPGAKVSASSDCVLVAGGKSRRLEIMNDYSGWWERRRRIDLRDSKYQKLIDEKALFLGICPASQKYVLIDFASNPEAKFIPFHPPYGKPAYSIRIQGSVGLRDLLLSRLVEELRESICGS